MKGQGLGDYCGMLDELWPLLRKYDQVDEENIDYMTTTDKHDDSQFLEKLSKFDPTTANNYKTMFEAAIQREHKKALKLGIMQGKEEGREEGREEGLREGELRGKEAIGSLLKQGIISQEQAKQVLREFL